MKLQEDIKVLSALKEKEINELKSLLIPALQYILKETAD
jgi:hypothetical protein